MRKRISQKIEKVGSSSMSSRKVLSLPSQLVIIANSRGFVNHKTMTVGHNHVAYLNT